MKVGSYSIIRSCKGKAFSFTTIEMTPQHNPVDDAEAMLYYVSYPIDVSISDKLGVAICMCIPTALVKKIMDI